MRAQRSDSAATTPPAAFSQSSSKHPDSSTSLDSPCSIWKREATIVFTAQRFRFKMLEGSEGVNMRTKTKTGLFIEIVTANHTPFSPT